jgi:hypothetical protein
LPLLGEWSIKLWQNSNNYFKKFNLTLVICRLKLEWPISGIFQKWKNVTRLKWCKFELGYTRLSHEICQLRRFHCPKNISKLLRVSRWINNTSKDHFKTTIRWFSGLGDDREKKGGHAHMQFFVIRTIYNFGIMIWT